MSDDGVLRKTWSTTTASGYLQQWKLLQYNQCYKNTNIFYSQRWLSFQSELHETVE